MQQGPFLVVGISNCLSYAAWFASVLQWFPVSDLHRHGATMRGEFVDSGNAQKPFIAETTLRRIIYDYDAPPLPSQIKSCRILAVARETRFFQTEKPGIP